MTTYFYSNNKYCYCNRYGDTIDTPNNLVLYANNMLNHAKEDLQITLPDSFLDAIIILEELFDTRKKLKKNLSKT